MSLMMRIIFVCVGLDASIRVRMGAIINMYNVQNVYTNRLVTMTSITACAQTDIPLAAVDFHCTAVLDRLFGVDPL